MTATEPGFHRSGSGKGLTSILSGYFSSVILRTTASPAARTLTK